MTSRLVPATETPSAVAPGPSAQPRPATDLLAASVAALLDEPDDVISVTPEVGYSLEDSEALYQGLDGEQTSDSPSKEAHPMGDPDVIMEEPPPVTFPSKKGQSGSSKKKR